MLISLLIALGVVLFAGYADKELNMAGRYKLFEVQEDDTTISAKDWKEMTSENMILTINKKKIATRINTYKNETTGRMKREREKYTYDDKYFYNKNEIKCFSYKYSNNTIKIKTLNDPQNTIWIYKKKK